MKKNIKVLTLLLAFFPFAAFADLMNCSDLYVGSIITENGAHFRVVFLNNPDDASGSQWTYFNHWTDLDSRKSALALLLAAKVSQLRVTVVTEAPGGCGITTDQRLARSLYLQ